jgi:hypothetical protein
MYKYQTKNNGKKLTKKLQKNQVHGLCERHKHSANPRIWGKKELNKNYKRIPKQNLLVYQITCVLITKYTIWQKVVPRTQRVFFFGNLFWPTVRKKNSIDQEKLLKFEAEDQECPKVLRSQDPFIRTVKGQYNFWNTTLF